MTNQTDETPAVEDAPVLKLCPFCGSVAESAITGAAECDNWRVTWCSNNYCPLSTCSMNTKTWNTRADLAPKTEAGVSVDVREAENAALKVALKNLMFHARQVTCTVKGMDDVISPLQRSIDRAAEFSAPVAPDAREATPELLYNITTVYQLECFVCSDVMESLQSEIVDAVRELEIWGWRRNGDGNAQCPNCSAPQDEPK